MCLVHLQHTQRSYTETAEIKTLKKKNDITCFAKGTQPRPQGFSLKKWVGPEKAVASAGHVSPRTP